MKKLLTVCRKFCLPFFEKSAYRGRKKLLTVQRKFSLPCEGKIILPRTGTYNQLMKELKKVKLLILDDWGINTFDPVEGRDILDVIEERNPNNSTVILSQLSTEDWHPLFSNPIVADAVMDRLVHGAHKIELTTSRSMRGEKNKNTSEK